MRDNRAGANEKETEKRDATAQHEQPNPSKAYLELFLGRIHTEGRGDRDQLLQFTLCGACGPGCCSSRKPPKGSYSIQEPLQGTFLLVSNRILQEAFVIICLL